MDSLENALRENQAYLCLSCGKCTAVCPISRLDAGFSPRRMVERALQDDAEEWLGGEDVWKCLTCLRCSELCPADVRFSEFTRDLRAAARAQGDPGACTHGDAIFTWMRLMQNPDLKQNRLDWVTEDLQISGDGDTLYFVGCLPYYDAMFGVGARHSQGSGCDCRPMTSQVTPSVENLAGNASPLHGNALAFEGVEIAWNTVRLLNRAGIVPRLLPDERCCGHDLLWAGDYEGFHRLAELNARMFAEAGIRRIVTACAECYRTLSMDSPGIAGVEVLHISQVLAQAAREGRISFDRQELPVTFHDPCRLGRHTGEYDAPRELLSAAAQLCEMERARQRAVCCGTSVWTQCGQTAKAIQVERLGEAAARAQVLVTACPKCQIHFYCAMDDPEADEAKKIEVRDLTTVLAKALP